MISFTICFRFSISLGVNVFVNSTFLIYCHNKKLFHFVVFNRYSFKYSITHSVFFPSLFGKSFITIDHAPLSLQYSIEPPVTSRICPMSSFCDNITRIGNVFFVLTYPILKHPSPSKKPLIHPSCRVGTTRVAIPVIDFEYRLLYAAINLNNPFSPEIFFSNTNLPFNIFIISPSPLSS